MKKLLLLAGILQAAISSAQVRFDTDFTAQSPVIFTFEDAHTDADGNTYLFYIDNDIYRRSFLSKIDSTGAVIWQDTVSVPNQVLSVGGSGNVMNVLGNRILIGTVSFPNSGLGQASILDYDTSGNLQHQLSINLNWSVGTWKVLQNAAGDTWFIYSYGDPYTSNPILYVRKMDSALNYTWQQTYTMPAMGLYVDATLDQNDNLYFTYTSDSVVGANHFTEAFTRKLDSNGNEIWLTNHSLCNYRKMEISGNQLIMAGQAYTTTSNWLANDTGDVILSMLDITNGNENYSDLYDGLTGTRDVFSGFSIDGSGNIYVCGNQDVNTNVIQYSSFVRKYAAAGNLIWHHSFPGNGYYSTSFGIRHDVYGDPWLFGVKTIGNGSATDFEVRRLNASGMIDSTLQYSIAPLYIGTAKGMVDAHGGIYVAFQQAQCGGNKVGVFSFGNQSVVNPKGIAESDFDLNGTIFPNPSAGNFSLQFDSENAGEVSVQLTDLSGKIISQKNISANAGTNLIAIDISGFSSGTYLLQLIQQEQKTAVYRLVKE